MNIADSKRIWMSTFHAMCARNSRWSHAQWLGYDDNFVIYDMDDQKRLYKSLIKELGLNDKYLLNQFLRASLHCQNNFVSPDAYMSKFRRFPQRKGRPLL